MTETYNLEVKNGEGNWRPITWRSGHGMCCPNWRNCGETSLSVGWHVRCMRDEETNELRCFQCETVIARVVE